MRLLKSNTITLTKVEREAFFEVFDPSLLNPTSIEDIDCGSMNSEEVGWLRFIFSSKVKMDEGTAAQRKVWSKATEVLQKLSEQLEWEKQWPTG